MIENSRIKLVKVFFSFALPGKREKCIIIATANVVHQSPKEMLGSSSGELTRRCRCRATTEIAQDRKRNERRIIPRERRARMRQMAEIEIESETENAGERQRDNSRTKEADRGGV